MLFSFFLKLSYYVCICFRRKPLTSKAMKLGGKSKDVDSFVDQLKSEGETVASDVTAMKSSKQVSKTVASQPQIKTERYDTIIL